MQIHVNGEPMSLAGSMTVSALLEQLQITGKRLAVELNEDIVPRSEHPQTPLQDGDRVEIVHAIGGG